MPAFFGFQAKPSFISETPQRLETFGQRQISLAEQFRDAFSILAD